MMALSNTPIHHPNATRIAGTKPGGLPASRRLSKLPSHCTVHTTETPPGTGLAVARNLAWPYSLIVDVQKRQILELLPLNFTAYSLRGSHIDTGQRIETNHAGRMHPQVSLVGHAAKMHEYEQADLNWLADEVFAPIVSRCGIANHWQRTYGAGDGIVLARGSSPIRLSLAGCQNFSGFLHHQTWYGQDHWDPGKLNVAYLEARIGGGVADAPKTKPASANDILGLGDFGQEVRDLQNVLVLWFGEDLVVNGDFDAETEAAVKRTQVKVGATEDGFWGPQSRLQLDIFMRKLAESVVSTDPVLEPSQ